MDTNIQTLKISEIDEIDESKDDYTSKNLLTISKSKYYKGYVLKYMFNNKVIVRKQPILKHLFYYINNIQKSNISNHFLFNSKFLYMLYLYSENKISRYELKKGLKGFYSTNLNNRLVYYKNRYKNIIGIAKHSLKRLNSSKFYNNYLIVNTTYGLFYGYIKNRIFKTMFYNSKILNILMGNINYKSRIYNMLKLEIEYIVRNQIKNTFNICNLKSKFLSH